MFANVRGHEWPKLRFLLVQILLTWTGLSIAMMVTDTLLLSTLGVKYLPAALLLTSLFTFTSSLAYGALLGRFTSLQLLQSSLLGSGGLLLVAFLGLKLGVSWLCLPLLAFYGASFSMLATQSFGLAGECIDTYSSKRLFPVLSVGATCGELLGGLLVAGAAHRVDPPGWVLAWSLWNFLALGWLLSHRVALQKWRLVGARPGQRHQRAVLQYLRKAPMARALTLLLLGMVLCQGTSQYLYSQVFARSFPRSRDLAHFLGILMAVTNLAELGIATQLTPRLVQWLGVARAGWLHPLSMLVGLLILSSDFQLAPAVLLWVCRRTLQDSLATPVRNLLYNAIPARVRAHLRAFLDGVVVSCAQACVAVLLILLQRFLAADQIVFVGVGLACIYCAGAWGASRNYLHTLVGELEVQGLRLEGPDSSPLSPRVGQEWTQLSLQQLETAGTPAALDALAAHPDPLALQILARGLASSQLGQRQGAAQRLGGSGEGGIRAALPYLFSDQTSTVEAALEVLGSSGTAWGRALLQAQFASRAQGAARAWLAAQGLQARDVPERFLGEALQQECARHRRLAFRALRWLEGEELVGTLRLALLAQDARNAGALEVLSNLGERQMAKLFVTLLEPNTSEDRVRQLNEALGKPALTEAALSDDPWVRWAAPRARPVWEMARMEQLLALRQTRPFHRLDLDQLENIRLRAVEERYRQGQTFWVAGQTVDRAFVMLAGEWQADFHGGVEMVGEMPARSALLSRGPLRLLRLNRADWEAALLEIPSLAVGAFQWLSAELRQAETRGSERKSSFPPPPGRQS